MVGVHTAAACIPTRDTYLFGLHAPGPVVGKAWEIVARRRLFPWFDRVDTKSNPVDGLSRGRMEGPWLKVETGKFASGLLRELQGRYAR